MRWRRWVAAVGAMLAVVFLPVSAWGSTSCDPEGGSSCPAAEGEPADAGVAPAGDPEPAEDPADAEPPAPEPVASEVEPVTTEPAADAPGVDTGVYLDPTTGSVRVDENTGVALGVSGWLAALVAGLTTSTRVLP